MKIEEAIKEIKGSCVSMIYGNIDNYSEALSTLLKLADNVGKLETMLNEQYEKSNDTEYQEGYLTGLVRAKATITDNI